MCGLLGAVLRTKSPRRKLDLASIRHRGPDGAGYVEFENGLLGHTRLSIVDLSTGAQPMSDETHSATIVFNGEIYNYALLRDELKARGRAFRTGSDTEVILNVYLEWGIEGFRRLEGMFAFAIRDHRDDSIVLARDPFGIKPLFIATDDKGMYFGSEIGAVLETFGLRFPVDHTSVYETLTHRYPIGEHTLYEGVRRLEPGTALRVSRWAASCVRERFFCLRSEIETQRDAATAATADEVRAKVAQSVARHCIADVEVACFLSGGIDSSIVTALAAAGASRELKAYTAGFSGARSERSETAQAAELTATINASLTAVEVEPKDFAILSQRLSGTLNGPFPDPADIAMLKLSARAAAEVKVVLSGEGADEAFAGYPKYSADRYARLLRPLALLADEGFRRRGKLGIVANALAAADPGERWLRWFDNDQPLAALTRSLVEEGADVARGVAWVREKIGAYPREWTNVQRMQSLDLELWLPNYLLHRGDYTTMQASLEQRVPFLDIELTPWAVALPDRLKFRAASGKAILRDAFRARLPATTARRRKSGFRLPLQEWLRGDNLLRDAVWDRLGSCRSAIRDYMGTAGVEKLLSDRSLSTTGGAKLVWTAYCLDLWFEAVRAGGTGTPRTLQAQDISVTVVP